MTATWTAAQIPDQHGRIAIVTGANSGLGLETARELARAGAQVVLACRNLQKGEAAMLDIGAAVPGAKIELAELDLGSLASVRAFAARFGADHGSLDLLINNAGASWLRRGGSRPTTSSCSSVPTISATSPSRVLSSG